MVDFTKLDYNHLAERELLASENFRRAMLEAAGPVVRQAQLYAPKRTGRLAASIHAEPELVDGQWEADVSWERDVYYGRFQEFGTRRMPAHPFLRPAADRYRF